MKQRETSAADSPEPGRAKVNKAELLILLANVPECDERLASVAGVLTGRIDPGEPSLRLLQMGEVAEATRLSRTAIWRLVRAKRLRTVDIGNGTLRVPEEELRRFLGVNRCPMVSS